MLPNVYVFDAYGTLFDVHSAVGRHEVEIGADFPRTFRSVAAQAT